MTEILVTGGTGTVGTPTVRELRRSGHTVRILSRRHAQDVITGDLVSGKGVRGAVDAVDCVVHLASSGGRSDIRAVRNLLSAARDAKVPHLVLLSIVGIDAIPVPFYRQRLEIEQAVATSGVAFTIVRSTQFHSFVDRSFSRQRWLPALIAPAFSYQSIAAGEVATGLAALAEGSPLGRVPDVGGPQRLPARTMAAAWQQATRSRRPIVTLRAPGRAFQAMMAGRNLVGGPPYGRGTFASYLAAKYPEGMR